MSGVGARVLRREDDRHLRGRGQFVADLHLPGQQEVAFLRSPVAHGLIRHLAAPDDARDRVFAQADLGGLKPIVARSTLPGYRDSEWHALAPGRVRFVGEPVAMAVAPDRAEAEDLVERIALEIEEWPALVTAAQALAADAPRLHDGWPDNRFVSLRYEKDFERHAAAAPVVVRRQVRLSRQAIVPLEGKAVLATWDERAGQLVVHTATQVPHMIRSGLAETLGLDEHAIRVIAPDVGGGFGYKLILQPEELCVAWLALTRRRPFRYVEDRREHLTAGANTRQHAYDLTAHADEEGRILALDAHVTVDGGAYSNWPFTAGIEPGQATGNLPGPYAIRGYRCRTECVATNKPAFLPYRGVARTGVCFAIELLVDAVARAVGRDPVDVRRDNLVPPAAMPFENVAGKRYDGGDYPGSLERAREAVGFDAIRARQAAGEADGRRIGVGFATYTEQTAHGAKVFGAWGLPIVPGYEQAVARITPDGALELRVGLQSHGQGLETTLAQIAHEELGLPLERIRVIHGDTGETPFSTGTYASRAIVWAGGAVAEACRALKPRLVAIGAHLMQAAVAETRLDRGRIVAPLAEASIREVAFAWYRDPTRLPPDVDPRGLEAVGGYRPATDTGTFSYATHAAVVAVDPDLGAVEILDYVVVEDCGRRINPMVVDGQTYGGTVQGLGSALFEESAYSADGQPLASTFADYLLPGAADVPAIRILHMETPSPHTTYGARGVGEGGAIAPPAAIFNAVNDAIHPLGAVVGETPLTPRRLLAALAEARLDR
ncbi:Caffeine dehydrogenase subunit alpha [Methylobacterium crusticola]|uniref:Caffeine dehydrogenase subunit alpha n=1 Tax=Methylobacterium crusticola TaxID=1697972 RepID=A0ABQ4QVH0_9HYPH|nr:xanthine dehydrogenase family protein molybdopterin-binding subunit [Methylobacterium crusticola]GJD48679.1 Caffeine dehydrogenase subunit alpha [Methylobacterium crusticola]